MEMNELQDEKQKVIQDYYAESQHCDEQKDIIAKQKAEIERLTKWYDTQSGLYNDLQDENKELKAEIERLTEERNMYADDLYWKAEVRKREDFITELTVENAELQKQVERLKIDLENEKNWGKIQTKQAVKDTAEEIFTDLLKEFSMRKSCGNADVVVREMAQRKGVEVDE